MEFTFKEILMYYMNKKYVLQTPLGELNPEDNENILPGKQIYVVLPLIRMLTPSVAVSFNKRDEYPSICNLASQLPRIICENQFQIIEDQWRQLPLVNIAEDIMIDEDPDKFWIEKERGSE
ncbi:hypothetical protein QTP88_026819 [Uroleucon formosanum]